MFGSPAVSWGGGRSVFELLDLRVGEQADVATLRGVLTDEAVEVLVAAALPRSIGHREVAVSIEHDFHKPMCSELAAVLPGQGMHTRTHRMQDAEHGVRDRGGRAVEHLAQPRAVALAVDHGNDAGRPLARDRVALPIAHAAPPFDHGGTFADAAPTKALALPWGPAAVAPPLPASAQLLPQRAVALSIGRDVLVGAVDGDGDLVGPGNLLGPPVLAQARFDHQPRLRVDPRQRARGAPALHGLPLRAAAAVPTLRRRIAPQLPADRAGDATSRPSSNTESGTVPPGSGARSSYATPLAGEAAQATAPGPLRWVGCCTSELNSPAN